MTVGVALAPCSLPATRRHNFEIAPGEVLAALPTAPPEGPEPLAALIASLLFGAAHGSWTALAPLAGAGLVLAAVYYRTGALSASMIAHAGFNAIGVAGYVFFKTT